MSHTRNSLGGPATRVRYCQAVAKPVGDDISHLPESLARDELWYRSPDTQLVIDLEGTIQAANPAAHALFGHADGALVGESIAVVFPGREREDRRRFQMGYEAAPPSLALSDPEDSMSGRVGRVSAVTSAGNLFPVHLGIAPVGTGSDLMLVAVRDMTKWVATEDELQDARHRQVLAEDHERIGRDLHDTVIQELFAAGMTLQALEQGLEGETAGRVTEVVDALDATIGRIRAVIFDLRKPVQVSRGLRRRLTEMVSGLTDALGFEPLCRLEGPLDTRLSDTMIEQVLAVVREALANVAKHAGATGVELLVRLDDDLLVEVVDDGEGIPAKVDRHSGMANLAHRAEEQGGTCEVTSAPGQGTRVSWRVPVGDV